jgi:Carboxypeptidase regulatory-like domain
MIRTTLLTALLCLTLSACGDDGDPPSADGALPDVGGDGAPDGGVPFTLAQGDDGHADVSAVLKAGQARAGRVTKSAQLVEGLKPEGKVGDFRLYNDKVVFIIRDTRFSDGYAPFGGELLDGARLDSAGKAGRSLFGELIIAAGISILEPTSVGVVADGSDGKAATVRAIGQPTQVPILAALLGTIGGTPNAHIVVDYTLGPGAEALTIRYRYFNKTTKKQAVPMAAMGITAGDGAEFFTDPHGFDVQRAGKTDFVSMIDPSIGYVLYSPEAKITPIFQKEGLWILSNDSFDIAAAGEGGRTYQLALTAGEPEAVRTAVRALRKSSAATKVSGSVKDAAGQPLSGVRVHVQLDDADSSYVTMTRTSAAGAYTLALPAGSYLFSAVAEGRELTASTKVTVGASAATQDLTLGGSGSYTFTVKDGVGATLPSKLVFKRKTKLNVPPGDFGELSFPGGAALILFSSGAGSATLPPGTYDVSASRGFEYEIASSTVTITDGGKQTGDLVLKRSVDTTGYMCGDFHVHAMWSPDSSDLYEHKVAAIAAEGLELPVITEHEYISDLSPYIVKAGLQKWTRGIIGEELTTFVYGHFNPFPITQDATKPNKGAMSWYKKDPATLFADVRTRWPDAVFQVNHPRDSITISGYFNYVGFDALTGKASKPAVWSRNFDAIEVFNNSGWSANKDKTVKDWFAFLDRGELVTATGNSDSHRAYGTEVGYPRNYVKLSTDDPAQLNLVEFAKSIKDQQVLVSGGPFVTVQAGGKSMGEVAKVSGGKIALEVKVQAPTWMSADTLTVIVGGSEVKTVTLDSSTADPQNPVVRYDSSVDLTVSADTWVVVVVTGSKSMDPVVRGDKPFAVTNPVYLDVDGNGVYDAPKSF